MQLALGVKGELVRPERGCGPVPYGHVKGDFVVHDLHAGEVLDEVLLDELVIDRLELRLDLPQVGVGKPAAVLLSLNIFMPSVKLLVQVDQGVLSLVGFAIGIDLIKQRHFFVAIKDVPKADKKLKAGS